VGVGGVHLSPQPALCSVPHSHEFLSPFLLYELGRKQLLSGTFPIYCACFPANPPIFCSFSIPNQFPACLVLSFFPIRPRGFASTLILYSSQFLFLFLASRSILDPEFSYIFYNCPDPSCTAPTAVFQSRSSDVSLLYFYFSFYLKRVFQNSNSQRLA